MNPSFWPGKRVLVTGHTGFKGAWLSLWLQRLGAHVTGFALPAATTPSLSALLEPWNALDSFAGDMRDAERVREVVVTAQPEVVFHLAAQSLVRRSYANPVETFSTNTIGTVHLLEALRSSSSLQAVIVVTSDKVYDQTVEGRAFDETDRLGGSDPYSASKAAQELVTGSYAASFFDACQVRVATCRAGNVIGGGDWAADRLVPDFYRAIAAADTLVVRHPEATRPWQHVFEPLRGYLTYAESLVAGEDIPGALNFGPAGSSLSVAEVLAELSSLSGAADSWRQSSGESWREHTELAINSSAAEKWLGWRPQLNIGEALELTADWYAAHASHGDMRHFSLQQIDEYQERVT